MGDFISPHQSPQSQSNQQCKCWRIKESMRTPFLETTRWKSSQYHIHGHNLYNNTLILIFAADLIADKWVGALGSATTEHTTRSSIVSSSHIDTQPPVFYVYGLIFGGHYISDRSWKWSKLCCCLLYLSVPLMDKYVTEIVIISSSGSVKVSLWYKSGSRMKSHSAEKERFARWFPEPMQSGAIECSQTDISFVESANVWWV